jgi:ferric-dicitrate binding protein FerR (iron transport regulator)
MEDQIRDKDRKLDDFIDLMGEGKRNFEAPRAYERFRKRTEPDIVALRRKRLVVRGLSVAAVILPFLVLSHFSYLYFKQSAIEEQVTPVVSEVVVPNGSKTHLLLQDGTKVWINAGSSIRCNTDFGKGTREITLSGEAYLEVAHIDGCPFIVSTDNVRVKVLGTRFNVSAYKENEEIKVSLLEGSIEMSASGNAPLLLSPRDIACYNPASGQTKVRNNATGDSIGWMENKLVFDGETFEQIIRTLERNFNVKVNIHNASVKNRRFVGDFVNNETIEQIFTVMSSDGKFNYKIKGNVIDVY